VQVYADLKHADVARRDSALKIARLSHKLLKKMMLFFHSSGIPGPNRLVPGISSAA
jgi:hypothetical protein